MFHLLYLDLHDALVDSIVIQCLILLQLHLPISQLHLFHLNVPNLTLYLNIQLLHNPNLLHSLSDLQSN